MSYDINKQELKNIPDDIYLDRNPHLAQALILGAYMEDKKKWEDNKMLLVQKITNLNKELDDLYTEKDQYSKIKTKLYQLFGKSTPIQKKIDAKEYDLYLLENNLNTAFDSGPDMMGYELALLGNQIFKM